MINIALVLWALLAFSCNFLLGLLPGMLFLLASSLYMLIYDHFRVISNYPEGEVKLYLTLVIDVAILGISILVNVFRNISFLEGGTHITEGILIGYIGVIFFEFIIHYAVCLEPNLPEHERIQYRHFVTQ